MLRTVFEFLTTLPPPYTPWSNGAIERLGKELLRIFRSITSELRMRPDDWPGLLPIVQSVSNSSPFSQRGGTEHVTAMTGFEATPPIRTFYRSSVLSPLTISETAQERILNHDRLLARLNELHPIIQTKLQEARKASRDTASKGVIPNYTEGDFVLVAREEFRACKKLSLRWHGPRRIVCAINDLVYQVEDLRNGQTENVHAARLKFYHYSSLSTEAVMPHIPSSETGMEVQRLLRLHETASGLMVQVSWHDLPPSENTDEPLQKIHEDVPDLLRKLLQRQNTPKALAVKAWKELQNFQRGV